MCSFRFTRSSRVAQRSWKRKGVLPEWDYLTYAQFWPTSDCIHLNSTGVPCKIPEKTKSWTVHGLWPTHTGTIGPGYCNDSWPFNVSLLKTIESDLLVRWPSYETEKPETNLWNHEWIKHGTCAASLPSLRGELNYFTTGLKLNKDTSLESVLAAGGIVPTKDSSIQYELSDIESAIRKGLGTSGNILCAWEKHTKLNHLYSIEICLDKNLTYIDCPVGKSSIWPANRSINNIGDLILSNSVLGSVKEYWHHARKFIKNVKVMQHNVYNKRGRYVRDTSIGNMFGNTEFCSGKESITYLRIVHS
ncbi:PREDICTED: ribonuclease Oy-like isoform X3 [Priapulus caudatus]|uniref:Ribonuclease Oy-like isoform X3 n=1 Tax=Priapulus caudatus TaxID=37621 RepID=A0ABM1F888_PRICU|nr:PREDICTED: ribonuclease Oy-like isoform X3 [Priapulus caudatus]